LFGLDGGGAAVGDEFRAVDVAGVVGGEEERMEPPSLKRGRAFWTVNRVPRR
jgi:hypothetical protein